MYMIYLYIDKYLCEVKRMNKVDVALISYLFIDKFVKVTAQISESSAVEVGKKRRAGFVLLEPCFDELDR